MTIGPEKTKEKLHRTKTEGQAIPSELRKNLIEWAHSKGGENLRTEMTRHFTELDRVFESTHNLWARVCQLYETEVGRGVEAEPPTQRIAEFLTFNELSNLVLGLCPEVLANWNREALAGNRQRKSGQLS